MPMSDPMNLYIIRHAWAEDRDSLRWPDDDLRPLTVDGKQRFALLMKKLSHCGMAPSIIATSPLVRCVETAGLVAAAMPEMPKIVELDDLRPGSNLAGLLRWTVRQADRHEEIAWVGHAPDVGCLTAALIGADDGLIRFAKGAVAALRFDGPPAAGSGELQWLATAKLLGV
jgi:phosphohistidine phosphatase